MTKRKKHSLWIESYRSKTLDQYVASDKFKEKIQGYIENNDIPHLIFAGPAGTGKTTLAKLIVNNIKCDYIYLNASDENGIDAIRDKIKGFASSATFQPLKVIILDEADFLTQPAQAALRNIIEEYSHTTRFILTCNFVDKLMEPLQSRCVVMRILPPSKGEVVEHMMSILSEEKIEISSPKDLVPLVNSFYPDIRSIIKYAQNSISEGKYQYNPMNMNYINMLINILKKPSKSSWSEIRQLVISEQLDDYQSVYRAMFDSLNEYSNGNDAEIIITIDEYSYRAGIVPDKEVNFSAFIVKILDIITTKKLLK